MNEGERLGRRKSRKGREEEKERRKDGRGIGEEERIVKEEERGGKRGGWEGLLKEEKGIGIEEYSIRYNICIMYNSICIIIYNI